MVAGEGGRSTGVLLYYVIEERKCIMAYVQANNFKRRTEIKQKLKYVYNRSKTCIVPTLGIIPTRLFELVMFTISPFDL